MSSRIPRAPHRETLLKKKKKKGKKRKRKLVFLTPKKFEIFM
jgi:hypothetical protein